VRAASSAASVISSADPSGGQITSLPERRRPCEAEIFRTKSTRQQSGKFHGRTVRNQDLISPTALFHHKLPAMAAGAAVTLQSSNPLLGML